MATLHVKFSFDGGDVKAIDLNENDTVAAALPAIFHKFGMDYNLVKNQYGLMYSSKERLNSNNNLNKTFKKLGVKSNRKVNIIKLDGMIMS